MIGALAAGLILAERPLARLGGALPGKPKRVLFETPAAVDDILIETELGHVYVQAKRTLPLSPKPDGELASVANQFVRQFRAGVIEDGGRRDLNPARDRLVLAVGPATAATITNDLRDVLDRNRTGSATGLPKALSTAVDVFGGLIEAAWQEEVGSKISAADRQAILAACSVIVIGDSERQIAEEGLRDLVAVAGTESALVDLLEKWAAGASQSGVGGDAPAIRLALGRKVELIEPPSFRADVAKLASYSGAVVQRLKRFTEVSAPEGSIFISRPVADIVIDAARRGSLAITGEPGAGKSAVIHRLAEVLSQDSVVVALTVEANAGSSDALRTEIGLEHPLSEVLAQMAGNKPAYLVLDALDAVRGGPAEATYKRLVEQVLSLPGWNVTASVRTFDLRLGREWRRLFAGTPPQAQHADQSFSAVRHVHIDVLSDEEKEDLATKSPSLAAAIAAGGPKMEALARNPFNLALLGDLLRSGVSADSLSSVATRGELLERYWAERVLELGTPATVSLKSLVELMIGSRSIDLPETNVPIAAAATVDSLQQAGVLVTEATRRLGFRHHVLFDYAVARLLLLPDRKVAVGYLTKASGAGLLLSPSLGFWLEALKKGLSSTEFWSFIVSLVCDDSADPIVRVEAARISSGLVRPTEDLRPLAKILEQDDPAKSRALAHLAGPLLTKASLKEPIETEAWAGLLASIISPKREQIGSIRGLVGALLENENSPEALHALGLVTRRLFDAMSADEQLIGWLAPHVIPYVVRTYGTDPAASRERLNQIFEPERFARVGYIEVPWLAHEVSSLAAHDPDFVVQLFYRVFLGGNFSRDQVTPMSRSWILSLTSNAAQDYAMATHSLSSEYPKLLQNSAKTGTRALAAALKGQREKEHPAKNDNRSSLNIGGAAWPFEEDSSYIWAWNIGEDEHDDYSKLYIAYLDWLATVDDEEILTKVPNFILAEATIALAWRTVFEIATRKPGILGAQVWRTASEPSALNSLDTRRSAIAAIAAAYPYLPELDKEAAEAEWLQRDFSAFPDPAEARTEIIGTLFETIGEERLATSAARDFLADQKRDARSFENRRPIEIRTRAGEGTHRLEREGVDLEAENVRQVLALGESVRAEIKALQEPATLEQGAALWNALGELEAALRCAGPLDSQVDREASDALAEGLGAALSGNHVPEAVHSEALDRLIVLTRHIHPEPSEDTEESFARFPSWGSPSPRVEAAQALAKLVPVPGMWTKIRHRFEEMLLNDAHPAVRLQLVPAIPLIGRVDEEGMWQIAERFAASEKNATLLKHGANALSYLSAADAKRVEPWIIEFSNRVEKSERGDDAITAHLMHLAVNKELTASRQTVEGWIGNYVNEERRLQSALHDVRSGILRGINTQDPAQGAIRERTREFLVALMTALEPAVRSWPLRGGDPTPAEVAALKLFNAVADQIYYAVGHNTLAPELEAVEAQRQFLSEYSAIISKLTTLGTPRSVHHLLEVLNKLIEADSGLCFDLLSEAMLRTTGVARYEHESMGASLFVKLVGLYLADYRSLFDDETRRRRLIECMALFVEAGWPEARKLFLSLPELLQ